MSKEGEIVGYVITFTDMTERNIAEEQSQKLRDELELRVKERTNELSEINHRFTMIFNTTSQGFWRIDNQAMTLEVNPGMVDILGRRKEQIVDHSIFDFIDDEDKIIFKQILKEDKESGGDYEVSLVRQDNSKRVCIFKIAPLKDASGSMSGSFAMVTDITDRVIAEKELFDAKTIAERANRAKSVFLASMSHELRTPMNSIIGFSQLLATDKKVSLGSRQKIYLEKILRSGEHLLELINKVLDLAKIESDNLEVCIESVNVFSVVHESIETLMPLAETRNIEIVSQDLNRAVCVAADYSRFREIVINLLSNAVKYNNPHGRVVLSYEKQDKNLRFSVADNGPGIAKDKIELLFEPFNRLGAETSTIEGSGIGLTITKRLVGLMHGTIEVESEFGKGTTIVICLPLAAYPCEEKQDLHQQTEENCSLMGDYTLLYVEDNIVNRELLEAILERTPNLKLLTAKDAEEGIEKAISQKPDIILMDINLPDLDGFEALEKLRGFPETKGIPVVAISGNVMPLDIKKAINAGFAEYLQKPYNISELYRIIGEILEEKFKVG